MRKRMQLCPMMTLGLKLRNRLSWRESKPRFIYGYVLGKSLD
jgi:hypothetical protein